MLLLYSDFSTPRASHFTVVSFGFHLSCIAFIPAHGFTNRKSYTTLWFQLEDTFQLTGTPQGFELVMFQLKDMLQGFKKCRVKYKT